MDAHFKSFDSTYRQINELAMVLSQYFWSDIYCLTSKQLHFFHSEMEAEINESQLKVNLKDSIIKEALNSGVDLRQYSQQVEQQLQEVFHLNLFQSRQEFLIFTIM